MHRYIADEFAAAAAFFNTVAQDQALQATLIAGVDASVASLRAGGKVLFCGNGGSAADAMHLAGELVGRLTMERAGLPGIALTDVSVVSAIGNDYGYEFVFDRQVQALGRPGDVLVGLSTSGKSPNVIKAFQRARAIGMVTIGMTRASGGLFGDHCDHLLGLPSDNTQRLQEGMKLVGHTYCALIERAMAA
ncbi:MAG: SIS domain-containing protein [Alphaproteobacteria bacterium]|nr:SIS domain-containing protein [Alphaproteobacteria bacterium]